MDVKFHDPGPKRPENSVVQVSVTVLFRVNVVISEVV